MTKKELLQLLRTKEVLVSFIKKDGTKRDMFCTLKPDVIPVIAGSTREQKYEHLITVFDLEKQDWRMINLENDWGVKV